MSYKKLLSLISDNYNVAKSIDKDEQQKIVRQLATGYRIDEESRSTWLATNEEATKLINNLEDDSIKKNFPFPSPCSTILPLLGPAAIAFASRLTPHIKQNGQVAKHIILKDDPDGILQQKADRRTKYMNYQLLQKSSSWLLETHKLLMVVGTWGISFRKVYRDFLERKNTSDFIHPRDVIINHNVHSLEKCSRYTIRNYYNENDLVSRINADYFLDVDLKKLHTTDNKYVDNDAEDEFPIYEILEQYCLLDLDDDGYYEPYVAVFHEQSETLFGIFPAFEIEDIVLNPKSDKIITIKKTPGIVAYYCIDNPDGGFYSIGLNHLMYQLNKGANTVFRQLVNSGTLASQQAGFVTRAVRPQERSLQFELGEFKVIDAPPNVNINDHFIKLPFPEPSQVLFSLLGMLMETGEKVGFITEILTGDTAGQNVPATTMLALIEQGTRAFKPVVEKLQLSSKTELELWAKLIRKYDTDEEYKIFHSLESVDAGSLIRYDFDEAALELTPVVDPTMSSEAHKYAQLQGVMQLMERGTIPNPLAAVKYYLEGLQIPSKMAEEFLTPPPGSDKPDPKVMKIQMDAQAKQQKLEFDQMKQAQTFELEKVKQDMAQMELVMRGYTAQATAEKMAIDADAVQKQTGFADEELNIKNRLATSQERKLDLEEQKLAHQKVKDSKVSKK